MAKTKVNTLEGTIKKVQRIRGYNARTGVLAFKLFNNESVTLTTTADKKELTGEGGQVLYIANDAAKGTLSGSASLVNFGLFEVQAGNPFEKKINEPLIRMHETIVKDSDGKFITSKTANGETDNEIQYLYYGGYAYSQGAIASSEEFSYDVATKEITLPTEISSIAKEIEVSYDAVIANADVLSYKANTNDTSYDLVIDTVLIVPCDEGTGKEAFKMVQIQGRAGSDRNFELATTGDFSKQNFNFTFQTGCGGDELFRVITYDEDEVI